MDRRKAEQSEVLTTKLLGLQLSNPVIVASGPIVDTSQNIIRAFDFGAGAVVTKTIFCGEPPKGYERTKLFSCGALNSTLYSRRSIDEWKDTIRTLCGQNLPVIASINGISPSELQHVAEEVVSAGCQALELGISCPNDGFQQGLTERSAFELTDAVRKAVSVPISVKLAAVGNLPKLVVSVLDAGADAISLSDTLPAVSVNVDQCILEFGGSVGYSGPGIKPIVLNAIYQLRASGITCPIIGIGGIETARDVLEYVQVGASAVQIYTALMKHGFSLLQKITSTLEEWCKVNEQIISTQVGIAMKQRQDEESE